MQRIMLRVCLLVILPVFFSCKKDTRPLNLALYNKPLNVIRSYTNGHWRLQYTDGGLFYRKFPARNNAYLSLINDHLVAGDDSSGKRLDVRIIWEKIRWGGDSLYVFSYYGNPGVVYPYFYMNEIKNDTLIISDVGSDGYNYHYTSF